jgi:peptidoglycan/xylan/chitin deacetylase (PgdA/CDA1 family)
VKKVPAVTLLLIAILAWTMVATSRSYVAKAQETRGVISIAFDDEYQNQYEYAFPLMQEYGIVGTFYICTSHIGLSGYMSVTQLQTLQSSGNEIGSHSVTHTDFTTLSTIQIQSECTNSKLFLESNGLTVKNFAYPDGTTNDNVDSIVSGYYRSARTAYVGPYLMNVPTNQFRLSGFSAETADSSALSLLKKMVDDVYSTNEWAIIFFHNIIPHVYTQPYTTSAEDFESFLNYTVSKGVRTLTVNQVLDLTALSVSANFGTVSPASGLYSVGKVVSIEAFSPFVGDGERYVWLGWMGSGSGSYTGTNNPFSIVLSGPVNQTAIWKHEFRLTVSAKTGNTSTPLSDNWYEAGSVANIEAVSPSAESGERFIWSEWKGTGSGSYSGSNTAASVTMNSQITQVATWIPQYFVNVSSVSGKTGGTGWYNWGATAYATLDTQIANVSSDIRYFFEGWSEDASGAGMTSDGMIVDGPLTAVASWKKQFLVAFDQTGLPEDFDASIVVNSTTHNLPFSVWAGEEDNLEYGFQDQYPDGFTGSYALTSPLGQSSYTVTSSVRIVAQYDSQYSMGTFTAIIVPLVLILLLASILLLKKRKQPP